jgi:predicted glycoside hydrolase/deacetylase ChbG (UPF0249 family)
MKLIINADDFGKSKSINEAIFNLISIGTISSTTVMVNMPFAHEATTLVENHNISIGWHVNITEGQPICDQAEVPSLVDNEGNFFSHKILLAKIKNKAIKYDELKKELFAQYSCLKGLIGDRLSHFDSHQGSTRIPLVYKALQELSVLEYKKFGIRVHSKYYLQQDNARCLIVKPTYTNITNYGLKRVVKEYYFRAKRNWWRKCFYTPDGMLFSKANNTYATLQELSEITQKIEVDGIFEISCHPATIIDDLVNTKMTDIRVQEYNLLQSNYFKKSLQFYTLVNYYNCKISKSR